MVQGMHAGQVGHRKGFRVIKWNGWWAQLLNNESADALTLWRFPVGTMDEGSFLCWLVSHMPSKDWDDVQWSIARCTLIDHHEEVHQEWRGNFIISTYISYGRGQMACISAKCIWCMVMETWYIVCPNNPLSVICWPQGFLLLRCQIHV